MSNFKLKYDNVMYQSGKFVVSNIRMTDEKAVAFLKNNPNLITLFSEYPENWRTLIGQKEYAGFVDELEVIAEDAGIDLVKDEECSPCQKRKELKAIKMPLLKKQYPEVPAPVGTKKVDFIEAILKTLY